MYLQFFFEGILAAFGSLVLEEIFILALKIQSVESTFFLLVAATIEEGLKFLLIFNSRLKLENKEKIVYAAPLLGLGFFAAEFFLRQHNELPALLNPQISGALFIHLFTTAVFGYFISKRYAFGLWGNFILIIFNTAIHYFYNLAILYS